MFEPILEAAWIFTKNTVQQRRIKKRVYLVSEQTRREISSLEDLEDLALADN